LENDTTIDKDVKDEEQRLQELSLVDDLVKVKRVKKHFGSFEAVKGITFGIKENECFGLLGPNGAGKTTAISMLTRELMPSVGNIHLDGESIWKISKQTQYRNARIGLCSQFDILDPFLTGREHLELFLRLRNNLLPEEVDSLVNEKLTRFKLETHADKITKEYSGGTKRKISVALALLEGNQIIFLDEPSTGMDPFARRSLWEAIEAKRNQGNTSIVLTTHSMEEAEAVCGRIGIMVGGRLQCLGSKQHLKNRFEDRYFIFVNCKEDSVESVIEFMKSTFPGSVLVENFGGSGIKYDLGHLESVALAFEQMEMHKERLGITEYSISQTTLEQVFMHFAKKQEDRNDNHSAIEIVFGQVPEQMQCPHCKSYIVTELTFEIGKFAFVVGALICVFGGLCCWCIPCLLKSCKNVVHNCPNCSARIGTMKRWF